MTKLPSLNAPQPGNERECTRERDDLPPKILLHREAPRRESATFDVAASTANTVSVQDRSLERSEIRDHEREPRISLRSCGLRQR